MQKEHENELVRQEKEQENNTKYAATGNVVAGIVNGVLGGALNSPEVQAEMSKKILERMNKSPDSQK